jgi:hypothetical protein
VNPHNNAQSKVKEYVQGGVKQQNVDKLNKLHQEFIQSQIDALQEQKQPRIGFNDTRARVSKSKEQITRYKSAEREVHPATAQISSPKNNNKKALNKS